MVENCPFTNMFGRDNLIMSEDTEKELKEFDHEEMREENHQLELQEGYEQDEEYDESED